MRAGQLSRDVLALLLNNVRTPDEREGDLGAQIAACHTGAERLREICRRYGLPRVTGAARELLDYSEQIMRAFLARVPVGTYSAEDFMDNDGISEKPVKIAVALTFSSRAKLAQFRSSSISPAPILKWKEASMRLRRSPTLPAFMFSDACWRKMCRQRLV